MERLYKVYEVETKEEAWGEYLTWEASIPPELAKPFRPVKTAFRNWKTYILNYFDDERVTNAFTESFNAKIRRVYRDACRIALTRPPFLFQVDQAIASDLT